jgi:hypothetical protein
VSHIQRVYAKVFLRPAVHRQTVRDVQADHLELMVILSAKTTTRCIDSNSSFGLGAPLRGLGAVWHQYRGPRLSDDPDEEEELLEQTYHLGTLDIEDGINEMLGRDPSLHRPPTLAWGSLIDVLASEGFPTTEQQLIDAPLIVEFAAEVLRALACS